jgi:hypothetical protein
LTFLELTTLATPWVEQEPSKNLNLQSANMEPRSQRMQLVLIIFILTIALYRDFGNTGTVRHLAKQAASFAGIEDHDPTLSALEPANATLGV